MKSLRVYGILFIIVIMVCVILPFVSAKTEVTNINQTRTIHEDEYYQYSFNPDESAKSYKIRIEWSSDYEIDVWVVDKDGYNNYINKNSFSTLYNDDGTWGVLNVELKPNQYNNAPYYVIFDNTDAGDVKPAWDGIDNKAYVTINGEKKAYIEDDSIFSNPSTYNAISIIIFIVIIIVGLIVWVFKRNRNKSQYYQQQYPSQQYPSYHYQEPINRQYQRYSSQPDSPHRIEDDYYEDRVTSPSHRSQYKPPKQKEEVRWIDDELEKIPKFCPECGKPTEGTGKFCKECGEKLI